jgi:hypothetical protein
MREDPRRRFVFGLTIENTTVRLWFCSRSDALVSLPFNFVKVRIICLYSEAYALTPYPRNRIDSCILRYPSCMPTLRSWVGILP